MDPVTQAAIEAVGDERPEDWTLAPERHAVALQPEAGPLKRILVRPELEQIMDAFNGSDHRALAAQRRYKLLARIASLASFFAVVIAGVLLLPAASTISAPALTGLAALQFVLIVTSFTASFVMASRKPFATWMHQRAEAENARINLFKRVVAAEEEMQTGELPLLPLQLEYFRRYQLDVQRLYYATRGRQHARAVRRSAWWRAFALFLIVAAATPVILDLMGREWMPESFHRLAAFLPPRSELPQRLFLCLGLIGGALQGLLASLALMSQDERNATRYVDTSRNLEDLSTRPLDEARDAAVAADRERVLAFVALVHEQISSEHREWIILRSISPDLSLDRLRAHGLPKLG